MKAETIRRPTWWLAVSVTLLATRAFSAEVHSPDPTWMPSRLYFFGGALRPRVMELVKDPDAPTGEAARARVGVQVAGTAADSYTYEQVPGRYVTKFFFKVADNTGDQPVVSFGIFGAVAKDPAAGGDNLIHLKASDFQQAGVYQAFEYRWSYFEYRYMVAMVHWHGTKDLCWGGIETNLLEPFRDDALLEIWRNPPKQDYYVPFPPPNAPLPQLAAALVPPRGAPRVHRVEGMFFDRFGVEEAIRQIPAATLTESETTAGAQDPDICPKFPSAETLFEHNVLVLANVDIRRLGVARRYLIREFVNRGGGLLVLGGPWTYGRCAMRGTWVDQLLPVETKGVSDWIALPPASELRWKRPGPALADRPCVRNVHDATVRPGAEVWFEAAGRPVLVGWPQGKGRVAAFLGTPMGEAGEGSVGFWESQSWPTALADVLGWLAGSTAQ